MKINKELSSNETAKAIAWTIVGAFFIGFILEPLAIFHATRALKYNPNNKTAYNTRVVAIILLCAYLFFIFCIGINALLAVR